MQDDEAFVTVGPLHPQPPQPGWMGPVPPAGSNATLVGSNNGSAINLDGGGPSKGWVQQLAPRDTKVVTPENVAQPTVAEAGRFVATVVVQAAQNVVVGAKNFETQAEKVLEEVTRSIPVTPRTSVVQVATVAAPRIKPVLLGSSTASDPIITVVPSLLQQVFNFISFSPSIFLRHLLVLHINHDTLVPNYFADNEVLVHLSFILSPQLGGHALEKVSLDYLDDEDEEPEMMAQEVEEDPTEMEHEENVADVVQENVDSDLEMLDAPPPVFMTQGRRELSR